MRSLPVRAATAIRTMPIRPAPIGKTSAAGPTSAWTAIAFVAVALFLQWPLLTNPGYFSHDELGWAARAGVAASDDVRPVSWTDIGAFQYRPLTFNLWLPLARVLHDSPQLFHLLWVVLGTAIALGLRAVLRRLGASEAVATIAALVFVLNPYAVHVHGWVATLADLLWVGAGLLLALWLLRERTAQRHAGGPVAAGVVVAAIALLAKEAAVVLAPLAWLAWWLSGRQRVWLLAAIGLSIPTAIYLLLRIEAILHAPRPDEAYAWSFASVPAAWFQYHLYPYLPTTAEVGTVFNASPSRLGLAAALFAATAAVACAAGRPLGVAFVLGSALALGPVLLLDAAYSQYGYGASALVVAVLGLAWRPSSWPARTVLVAAAAVCVWHGANGQRTIRRAGELQAVFTPSLREAVAGHRHGILRLAPEREGDTWLYRRLSHEPLTYGAGGGGPRVVIVAGGEPADRRIAADGRVLAPAAP